MYSFLLDIPFSFMLKYIFVVIDLYFLQNFVEVKKNNVALNINSQWVDF